MATLLLVDDEYLVRYGLRTTIDWEAYGISIVGEASNGMEALEMIGKYKPDIIITDVCMPIMDGLEFISELKKKNQNCVIIILSGYGEFGFAKEAIRNGAFAYVLKPIDDEELIGIIQEAVAKVQKNTYTESLENALPYHKQDFIENLFQKDTISIDIYREKTAFFNLDLFDQGFCVVYLKVDTLNTDIANQFLTVVNMCCSDALGMKTLVNPREKGDIVILVTFEKLDDLILDKVKILCRAIISKTKLLCIFTAGISSVTNIVENINSLYCESLKASSFKSHLDNSNVITISETNAVIFRKEVRETIKCINENYAQNLTVMRMANNLYMSQSNLMHIFREETGLTVNEYLTKTRIEAAKTLLQDIGYKVYEVAELVGYSDVKYFTRIFKQMTGYTPIEYAKSARKP